jgi:triose/dihydroxyacetone kinase / FAD-AMP lyase (cyclizing)
MPGFSISLLLLPSQDDLSGPSAELLLSLLDEQPQVPGWKWSSGSIPFVESSPPAPMASSPAKPQASHVVRASADPKGFINLLENICHSLIRAEPEITRMDTIAGDGDCGTTLKSGAMGTMPSTHGVLISTNTMHTAVLYAIQQGSVKGEDVVGSVVTLARVADENMGGTSGALYSSVLLQQVRKAFHRKNLVSSSPVSPKAFKDHRRARLSLPMIGLMLSPLRLTGSTPIRVLGHHPVH